jgi:hypothetical protein
MRLIIIGKIIFPNKFIWSLELFSSKPPRKTSRPSFYIYFEKENGKRKSDNFLIIEKFDENKLHIHIHGSNIPTAEGIEGLYPLDSYKDSLKTILRRLFEAQLLRD